MNKFRVWDKREEEYLSGSELDEAYINSDGDLCINRWDDLYQHYRMTVYDMPCEYYAVEFFTGFSDKNGREIYEGDLITHAHSDQPHRVFFGKEQGCFYAEYWDTFRSCKPLALLHETEIIGTVHDVLPAQ